MTIAIAPVSTGTSQAAAGTQQQQAALRQLLAKYTYDQARGTDQGTLSNLGKQIQAAAKALGQHVTLPRAPSSTAPSSTAPSSTAPSSTAAAPTSQKSKLSVTA
jgi:hypothetical protein